MSENMLQIVLETMHEVLKEKNLLDKKFAPIGISARHLHLSRADVDRLFGVGYQLTPIKDLSQPGQFASKETVELVGPKGSINKVRVLGPERAQTQVELALSDARKLGIQPPVRVSGDLKNTIGIKLRTDKGEVILEEGVIVASRHLHINPRQAEIYGFKDRDVIQAKIPGLKGGIMDQIIVRVHPEYNLDLHVDTDEASAFLLQQGQLVEVKKTSILGREE